MNKIYDRIYIGSNPIQLIDALLHATGDKPQLIIDQQERVGGAWRNIDFHDFEIETGCHIWDNDSEVFEFLIKEFYIDMRCLTPKPRIKYKSLLLPYNWKNVIFEMKKKKFSPKQLLRIIKSLNPKNYNYPNFGSAELIGNILSKLQRSNVTIINGKKISKISLTTNKAVVDCESDSYSGNHIVTSSFSEISELYLDGVLSKNMKVEESVFAHLHLEVDSAFEAKFSYIRWFNHSVIHRLSSAKKTYHFKGNSDVISVGLFLGKKTSEEEIYQTVISELSKNSFVPKSSILNHKFTYEVQLRTKIDDELENSYPISIFRNTNFIFGLRNRLPFWKSLLATVNTKSHIPE